MNFGLILSGGVGLRMKSDVPKQYIEFDGKPVIAYTLEKFQMSGDIDCIVIVAAKEWRNKILEWNDRYGITKFMSFADPGEVRQESVLNGVRECCRYSKSEDDVVLIHDAVRPFVSTDLIKRCVDTAKERDGCLPTLPMTDTVYQSLDGKTVTSLLKRSTLVAGQTPEGFKLNPYYRIHDGVTEEELARCVGANMIAFEHGLEIVCVPGEDTNFKLTTPADVVRCRMILDEEKKKQ